MISATGSIAHDDVDSSGREDAAPTVALLSDLWPSQSQPFAGAFVRASVVAVGGQARFVVLTPHLVASGLHRIVWGGQVPGWQQGWEAPSAPHRLLRYPLVRIPRAGEVRAVGADWALRRAREKPDLVHGHFLHEVGVAAVHLAQRRGIPVVVTVHGTDARWLLSGGIQARHRRRMLAAARAADRVLVVTDQMRDALGELGVERTEVLPMGVDATVFRLRDRAEVRSELGVDKDARIVLFVGRPTPEKGLPVLERAIERLPGVVAFAAGPMPPPGPVRGLGVLPPESLASWLSAADVLCLPSHEEGAPVAVLEALAAGTPVVATPVGAIPKQLGGVGGLLVEQGDDVALASALEEALNRPWDRHTIRRASRPYWWSVLGPRLAEVYRSLLR